MGPRLLLNQSSKTPGAHRYKSIICCVVRWVDQGYNLFDSHYLTCCEETLQLNITSAREWHDAFVKCPYALTSVRSLAHVHLLGCTDRHTVRPETFRIPIKMRPQSIRSLTELPSSHSPSAVPREGYGPAGHRPWLFRSRKRTRRAFRAGVANCSLL